MGGDMPWYKYLPNEYAAIMIEKGIIRLGSLIDYQNEEIYGTHIGDKKEGIKTTTSLLNGNIRSQNDLNEFERKIINISPEFKGNLTFKECTVTYSEIARNALVYSISDSFNVYCLKRISRESSVQYDTCVRIIDPEKFIKCINEKLKNEYKLIGGIYCAYRERDTFYSGKEDPVHPGIIKDPK